ncbi:hypothetical protein D3C76_849890 [compost metagenome]
MQGARHQLLAGAALAADQHRRVVGRQLAQQGAQIPDVLAVAEQFVPLPDVGRARMLAQAGLAVGAAQGHLHQHVVERQGMEIEEPFTDEIHQAPDIQRTRGQHGDPFGPAAVDQLLDGLHPLQVRGRQAQQADIAAGHIGLAQHPPFDTPPGGGKARNQLLAIGAGVHHQQAPRKLPVGQNLLFPHHLFFYPTGLAVRFDETVA